MEKHETTQTINHKIGFTRTKPSTTINQIQLQNSDNDLIFKNDKIIKK